MSRLPMPDSFSQNKFGSALNSKMPEPGKGYIYKAVVKRAGKPDAVYIGATTRSVQQRFSDRRKEVAKLFGQINVYYGPGRRGKNRKIYDLPLDTEPLQVLLRTAGGVTSPSMDPFQYMEVQYVGEYSLIALADAEKHFIKMTGGGVLTPKAPMIYENLLDTISLNKGIGGEGLALSKIGVEVKTIAAFYHLKDELKYQPLNELDLLWRIASYAYKANVSYSYDTKEIQTVKRRLMTFFSIKEGLIGYINDNPSRFNTQASIRAAVKMSLVDIGKGGKFDLSAKKTVAKLGLENESLLNFYNGVRQQPKLTMTQFFNLEDSIVKDITSKYIEKIDEQIETVLDNINAKKSSNKKR